MIIIYAVLSHFDFVTKFTVKNLNKDFTNTGRHHFVKVFHKILFFLKDGFPGHGLIEIDNLFYNYISLVGNMRLWWRRCSYRAHLTSFIE